MKASETISPNSQYTKESILTEKEEFIFSEVQLTLDTIIRVLQSVRVMNISTAGSMSVLIPEYNNILTLARDLEHILVPDLSRAVAHPPLFTLTLACALDLAGAFANSLAIGHASTLKSNYDSDLMVVFSRALDLSFDLAFTLALVGAIVSIRDHNLDPSNALADALATVHASALANVHANAFSHIDDFSFLSILDRASARARVRALDYALAYPEKVQDADVSPGKVQDAEVNPEVPVDSSDKSMPFRHPPTGLSPELCKHLRQILATVHHFDNDLTLRMLFVDSRIVPWRDIIPDNTLSLHRRVAGVIYTLYEKADKDGTNALYLFLNVLADNTHSADYLRVELDALIKELEKLNKKRDKPSARFVAE